MCCTRTIEVVARSISILVIWTARSRFGRPRLGSAGDGAQAMCREISRIYLVTLEMKEEVIHKDLFISDKT